MVDTDSSSHVFHQRSGDTFFFYAGDGQDSEQHNHSTISHDETTTKSPSHSMQRHMSRHSSVLDELSYRSCLRAHYSLRTQLFLSFGTLALFSVSFVMIASIVTAWNAGQEVGAVGRRNLEEWAHEKTRSVAKQVAEIIDTHLLSLNGMGNIMLEATQDRFQGYPNAPGYETDTLTPFMDHYTNTNMYPLKATELLPLDFQILGNVNVDNLEEHVLKDRYAWFHPNARVDTSHAMITFQGDCDPDPTSRRHHPNCLTLEERINNATINIAANNLETGGSKQPTATFRSIHERVSDYATPVLKALHEYHDSVHVVGIYFANDGAGASVAYPAYLRDATRTFRSIGCDWMRQPNPHDTSRPIGTEEQIARCHQEADDVPAHEYNPLERAWCRDQALHPFSFQSVGPYTDAFSNLKLMTFGRAMYDRVTKELIACTLIDVSVTKLTEVLGTIRFADDGSAISLVRWDQEGTVISAFPSNEDKNAAVNLRVDQLETAVTFDTFVRMKEDFEWHYHVHKSPVTHIYQSNGRQASSFPIPIPPEQYDPHYKPEFMVIVTIEDAVIFAPAERLDHEVDNEVERLMRNILIAGFAGFATILLVIYLVSLCLTLPLEWMNKLGDQIIHSFGSGRTNTAFPEVPWSARYAPRTEITKLVDQFKKMIKRFSGTGTAKLHKRSLLEVKNPFALHKTFRDLYEARSDKTFQYGYDEPNDRPEQPEEAPSVPKSSNSSVLFDGMEDRAHYGPNLRVADTVFRSVSAISVDSIDERRAILSPLFRWVLGTLTIPLIITTLGLIVYALVNIAHSLPSLVDTVEETYVGLERDSLQATATLRAQYASSLMSLAIRDISVYARVANWILFGALQMANTFAAMTTQAERCKQYEQGTCPLSPPTACDCSWNDPLASILDIPCTNYEDDGRLLQQSFFEVLSEDALPNGDRFFTTYPAVASTPNKTEFWAGIDELPGVENGLQPGLETTFQRIRAIAALSMIQFPLYNYGKNISTSLRLFSLHAGLDADGSWTGYQGCSSSFAYVAHFQSNRMNRAFELAPRLCPLGKYGYDPRCRDWYVLGKEKAMRPGAPLFVTPPYPFAGDAITGISATLPLMNTATGQFVGVAEADLTPERVFRILTQKHTPLTPGGFHILITANKDSRGTNTLVGPGFRIGEDFDAIADLVLPLDKCTGPLDMSPSCDTRYQVERIVADMQAGKTSHTTFERTIDDDGRVQTVNLAYAPVNVTSMRPLDPSDISRGVQVYNTTIFSLGLAETEDGLREVFDARRAPLDDTVERSVWILSFLFVVAFLIMIYITARVSLSVSTPIRKLLLLVIGINRNDFDVDDEFPEIVGASSEVARVRETFERLYMVLRFANTAFYAGDLTKAYCCFEEALALFKKLDNTKAIGIANNNLGNIMLAMYRTMKRTGLAEICGMNKDTIIEKGCVHFKTAIDIGEEAIERINKEEGWSTNYLVFMQQLSNRYFNRAMFLLTVREDHPTPSEAEYQGMMDLSTCKDMDREVVDNGDCEGFKGERDVYFELLMGRIRGVLKLMALGYEDEWGLDELFCDTRNELLLAMKEPGHALFRHMEPAGQMQRLDNALIVYHMGTTPTFPHCEPAKLMQAATIAVRMLIEDDYVVGEAALNAIKALLKYLQHKDNSDSLVLEHEEKENQRYQEIRSTLLRYAGTIEGTMSLQLSKGDAFTRASYRSCNAGDFSMEFF